MKWFGLYEWFGKKLLHNSITNVTLKVVKKEAAKRLQKKRSDSVTAAEMAQKYSSTSVINKRQLPRALRKESKRIPYHVSDG